MTQKIEYLNKSLEFNTTSIKDASLRIKTEKAIQKVFSGFNFLENEQAPIFTFYFVDSFNGVWDNDADYYSMGGVSFQKGKYKASNHGAEIIFDATKELPVIYFLVSNNTKNETLTRLSNSGFASNIEIQINVFYYRVFLSFMQWWNVKNDYSFIHASSFSYNKGGYLLTATSGIGKSAFLLSASRDKSFKFIADDLAIVNSAGFSNFLGRKISIKPYHFSYFPWLKSIIKKNMPLVQNFQWKLLANRKPLSYSLSPNDLFNGAVDDAMKIRKVIHLMNHNSTEFKTMKISAEDLSKINVSIMQTELFLALEFFSKFNYFPDNSNPDCSFTHDKFSKEMGGLYTDLFNSVEIICVLVPYRSNPNKLYEYLKSNVL